MRSPRVVLAFTVRSEPDWFVRDMLANVAWVDEAVCVTVPDSGPWLPEGEQNALKRQAVRDAVGSDVWTLWLDPDERLQVNAERVIRSELPSAQHGADTVFGFPLREMWTPTAYRVDAGWAEKKPRRRLFYLKPEGRQRFSDRPIHCPAPPMGMARYRVELPVNLYHLKSIEPANREARGRAYEAADPEFRHQRVTSWDWLTDETGLATEAIPPGRGFLPPYDRPYNFASPE